MITQNWLGEHECKFTNSGEEVRYNCPECDDDNFHLYVNRNTNLYHCFKCGFSGKVVATHEIDVQDYSEVIRSQFNLPSNKIRLIKNLPPSRQISYNSMTANERRAYNYLTSRNVNERQIGEHKIRYGLGANTKYSNSIIFPIYESDRSNELKYFVCRKIEGEPKYVNAPWSKDSTLFFTKNNWLTKNPVIIVEGIFDALAIERAGYPAIALLGKEPTKEQSKVIIKIIEHYPRTLIFLDHDALTYAVKLRLDLSSFPNMKIITSEFHDPDSIPTDILRELLEYHSND